MCKLGLADSTTLLVLPCPSSLPLPYRSRPATIKLRRCTTACCSLLSSADPVAIPTPRFSRNRAIDRGVTHARTRSYASLRRFSSRWKDPKRKKKAFIQSIGMNALGICKYCSCLFSRRFLLYLIVLPIPARNLWEPSSHLASRSIVQLASMSYCARRIYQLHVLMYVVTLLNYRWPIECYLLVCVIYLRRLPIWETVSNNFQNGGLKAERLQIIAFIWSNLDYHRRHSYIYYCSASTHY